MFVAWGLWLGVWTVVQLVFLHATLPERTIQWVMLGGAAAGAIASGAAIWQLGRARRTTKTVRLITDDSAATAAFAVGLAVALVGASFGLFLLLIGGGHRRTRSRRTGPRADRPRPRPRAGEDP